MPRPKGRQSGRQPNAAYRTREHLTEKEMAVLLDTLKCNRYGISRLADRARDLPAWFTGLGSLRSPVGQHRLCERTVLIRRLKGSNDSTHYLERDELAGLKRLQREQEPKSAYVFISERGQPFGRMGIARVIERAGEAAGLPLPVHAHMLRHAGWGRQPGGYASPATLPRPRVNHEEAALHGHVAGAVQGCLAMSRTGLAAASAA